MKQKMIKYNVALLDRTMVDVQPRSCEFTKYVEIKGTDIEDAMLKAFIKHGRTHYCTLIWNSKEYRNYEMNDMFRKPQDDMMHLAD